MTFYLSILLSGLISSCTVGKGITVAVLALCRLNYATSNERLIMELEIFLAFIMIIIVFGGITGAIASSNGHNFWLFFIIGALISPLLGIILAFVIKGEKKQRAVSRYARNRPTRGRVASTNRIDRNNPYSPPRRNYR